MAVPDFQSFMLPMLKLMADGLEHPVAFMMERLATEMNLTEQDLLERLPSGTQTRFGNRVRWSAIYLAKAGALRRIRRGVFQLADRGRELLAGHHEKITVKLLNRYPEFLEFHERRPSRDESQPPPQPDIEERTPQELLEAGYIQLRSSLANEILEAVKNPRHLSLRTWW